MRKRGDIKLPHTTPLISHILIKTHSRLSLSCCWAILEGFVKTYEACLEKGAKQSGINTNDSVKYLQMSIKGQPLLHDATNVSRSSPRLVRELSFVLRRMRWFAWFTTWPSGCSDHHSARSQRHISQAPDCSLSTGKFFPHPATRMHSCLLDYTAL